MLKPLRVLLPALALALLLPGAQPVMAQCVSLTTLGSASTQSFNTLSSTAGSTTNNLTITGWFLTESGGGARDNEQYAVDTGGSNTGDTFSYGAAGNSERALGGLQSGTLIPVIGACFTNNSGATITTLDIAYTGEQWRIGNTAAARDDRLDFQYSLNATSLTTGTWTDVDALDFVNPIKTAGVAGALDGNAAANRTAISNSIASLSIANGATFWIRWNDLNASGADDGLAADDFSLTPQGGPPVPTLNVSDVSLAEGNPPGTTTFTFAVTLTVPAGPGGVTFDIATADGTAQDDNPATEDNDYVAQSLTGQSIPAGSTGPYNFSVTVNRDTTTEPNETFFVNVTNVVGANAGDVQGLGTINNDDVTVTPIHDIQGPGASSPIVGSSVTTIGIVTGVRSNGFFIQEPDASVDADPATSEGILVFVNPPPAAAVVGARVQVTGTVTEFVPTQDALQPPLTELTSPTVVQLSTGHPLPVPVPLSPTFPDPAGPHDQLERLEGMRVSLASLTVVGPTLGTLTETAANSTSTGVFYGVATGVARPFREPGIPAPDPPPSGSGTIPPIPRFDSNPERIRVDSDGQVGGPLIDVGTGAVVTGLVGPLDYTFRTYTILPDPGATLGVAGGPTPTTVAAATAQEFTVASYNMQRFYDTVNDPNGDTVLTPAAFERRLAKASLAIRNSLRMPDIVGISEMENLSTLQTLAARISTDAVAAGQPDPEYDAYLVEGNDIGGIDVAFLVKTAPVVGATPRVTVNAVVQELAGTLFVNPDSSTSLLNDRPPLRLMAVINHLNGASFPVTVIANHLRSLGDVNSEAPGPNGWPTDGARVRAKRQEQAEDLANLVQARQTADPTERIILLGDFNAFEFNDGLGHSMGVISGTPAPDNETAVPGDGVDLVNPDFDNLFDSPPPAERYSYVFDGNAQNLDHILINVPLDAATVAHRAEHARINADFPETARNDATTPVRLSDHDPLVAYFQVAGFTTADLSITKTDSPDPVTAGTSLTYTVTVTNGGPDPASTVAWSDTLPAGTTFVSLSAAAGWSCTTPAVGAGGTVSCSIATLAVGSAAFTLTVAVDGGVAAGTVLSNTASVTSSTSDPDTGDLSATATTTVTASADLSVTKTDSPDPVDAGANLTYTITVANGGPSNAATVALSDTLPAGTTFVSLSAPGGWSCTTPAVGAGGTVSCSNASLAPGSAVFTLTVAVDGTVSDGTVLSNTAAVTSATPDPEVGNESATATTTVSNPVPTLSITKTDDPEPVLTDSDLTYTITVTNSGVVTLQSAQLTDALPAGTTFVSLIAAAGWTCNDIEPGDTGTLTCSTTSWAPGSAVFTLVVHVSPTVAGGTTLTNVAQLDASDGKGTFTQTTSATTLVLSPANVSATKTVSGTTFAPGTAVTYTVVLSNSSAHDQSDNPGAEFTDVLPAELTLVSASADSGTATPTVATNTVTWNGSIVAGGSVTITIQAVIEAGVADGTVVSNQGTVAFDADGNGSNEGSALTDDPAVGGAADPTAFAVTVEGGGGGGFVPEIPTLNEVGLALLSLLLALGGAVLLRRRTRSS